MMTATELYTIDERKSNGIFYTPKFLSDYLAKKISQYLKNKENISLLDPACGDNMLLSSFISQATISNITIENVIGIDKDIVAINNSSEFGKVSPTINIQLLNTDSLFPFKSKLSNEGWKKLRNKYNHKRKFDVIISNPPWGASLKEYDNDLLSSNYSLAKGQFDIYALFIELILRNLSANGVYGLIIPDSIFNHEQTNLRKYLTQKTTIYYIARLGEKIFPEINRACSLVIGSNNKPTEIHKVDCMRLPVNFRKKILSKEISLEDVENELLHKVVQQRFSTNENYLFDIDLRNSEEGTLKRIETSSISLSRIVTNTRGAELSKKGVVCKCPICGKWMPYPKSEIFKCKHCNKSINIAQIKSEKIIHPHEEKGCAKLKVGEDLYRYTSRYKCWMDISKDGINYKNPSIYKGEKILVRKTGVGITASIDYDNSYTNQVVYILKLKPELKKFLTLEFVLSVLNSRIITYYLIKKYGENEWRTHPYLTQKMLISLPFPEIDYSSDILRKKINDITELIKKEIVDSNEKNISKKTDIIIEQFVASLYGLKLKDYLEIFDTLNSSEQLIPIKRLTNCTANEIFSKDGI
ncbi:N-6 DNA methylase [Dysgonomonas sp. 25]|uniref:N-6 DNA methylase n=1 Tax=Dysgonomonas sp. 25 TaxID=2302933 RepID=UPI0013D1476C|nr:N-6 DNA methylase [Dysgonomonas sp. 25]NDV67486.1 hypothetical protein [Dysgonomonas sp. 25]